jgi:hypothetical protein
VESEFPEHLFAAVGSLLKGRVASAIVFGSVARQEETALSDLDICCVVKDRQSVSAVETAINAGAQTIYQEYGVRLSPMVCTVAEFRKKRDSPVVKDVLDHGLHIVGQKPGSILDGKAKRQKDRRTVKIQRVRKGG